MWASCCNEQLIWKQRTSVFASIWKRKPKLFHLTCVRILWHFFRAAELIHALHIIRVRRNPNPINRELNTFSMIYWRSKLIFSHCINKNGPVFSLSLCYINASESLLRIVFFNLISLFKFYTYKCAGFLAAK